MRLTPLYTKIMRNAVQVGDRLVFHCAYHGPMRMGDLSTTNFKHQCAECHAIGLLVNRAIVHAEGTGEEKPIEALVDSVARACRDPNLAKADIQLFRQPKIRFREAAQERLARKGTIVLPD